MKAFNRIVTAWSVLLVLVAGCFAIVPAYAASTAEQTLTRKVDVSPGARVSVDNLVGRMKVTQGGQQLEVVAHVVAGGENQGAAQALANAIKLDVATSGGHVKVHVNYPVSQYDSFVYRRMGDHKDRDHDNCLFGFLCGNSSSSFTYQGQDVRVFRNQGKGPRLYVDLEVKLPAGVDADLFDHVGFLSVTGLKNNLSLHADSADVKAGSVTGQLELETGSGDISLADLQGSVVVRTGSGDVDASHIKGNVNIHTGSGDIEGGNISGDTLETRTGSGDVTLDGLAGALNVRSGSGDIQLTDVAAGAGSTVSTGSGDISLAGDLSKMQGFELGAGSGDIKLATGRPPEVHLNITTGSGDIEVHWPNVTHVSTTDNSFEGDVGNAKAVGRIHTGSGDVVLQE